MGLKEGMSPLEVMRMMGHEVGEWELARHPNWLQQLVCSKCGAKALVGHRPTIHNSQLMVVQYPAHSCFGVQPPGDARNK